MSKFNIAEAKTHFSKLVRKAMLGEEVIISKGNKPVLKLVLLDKPKRARKPGSGKGAGWGQSKHCFAAKEDAAPLADARSNAYSDPDQTTAGLHNSRVAAGWSCPKPHIGNLYSIWDALPFHIRRSFLPVWTEP